MTQLRGVEKGGTKKRAKDNLIGFIAGACFIGLSELDADWGMFWLIAGAVLIAWSVISIYIGKGK